jgi:large subunit ribosomal protein L32
MPNPKRRHSKSRKRLRRTHDALTAPTLTRCSKCNATKRPHTVCPSCGYYGDHDVGVRENE